MAKEIKFTSNYEDKSTDTGYQFQFFCDRCGNGYKSRFQGSVSGTVSTVLSGAGSLLGGFFSSASDVSDRVKSATWEKAHEEALEKAGDEIIDNFIQCPRCSDWVCRDKCWNLEKGLCKKCAPDLGVEMAAAQASKSVEEVWAHAAMAEEDKKLGKEYWREGITASCPSCEKSLQKNAKFCPNCGYSLKDKSKCSKCGAKLVENSKFCGECGEKVNP